MSNFLVSLWESVFTPGPTPTLLVATNASFAALQLVLFALLLATYSIHFIVLSFLCAGLWWSINWFVAELQASKAQEAEAKKEADAIEDEREIIARHDERAGSPGDTSETETEEATPAPKDRSAQQGLTSTSGTARLRPEDGESVRKRRSAAGASESEGSVSTDSEWEKVDQ